MYIFHSYCMMFFKIKVKTTFYRFIFRFICIVLPWVKIRQHLLLHFLYQVCDVTVNKTDWMGNIRNFICLFLENSAFYTYFIDRFGTIGPESSKNLQYCLRTKKGKGKSCPVLLECSINLNSLGSLAWLATTFCKYLSGAIFLSHAVYLLAVLDIIWVRPKRTYTVSAGRDPDLWRIVNIVTGNQRREPRLTTDKNTHQFITLLSARPQISIVVTYSPEICKPQAHVTLDKHVTRNKTEENSVA
jgi:hypothetical protein